MVPRTIGIAESSKAQNALLPHRTPVFPTSIASMHLQKGEKKSLKFALSVSYESKKGSSGMEEAGPNLSKKALTPSTTDGATHANNRHMAATSFHRNPRPCSSAGGN